MLSMKTLRVAIVTMGSALLAGALNSWAVDVDLNSTEQQGVVTFATETLCLEGATTTVGGTANYCDVNAGSGGLTVSTTTKATLSDYFLRVKLSDMVFRGNPAVDATDSGGGAAGEGDPGEPVYGGDGSSEAVYSVDTANGGKITITLTDNLALASKMPGSYMIAMSLHRNIDDAIDGIGASSLGGGQGTIINTMSGVNVAVTPNKAAVADVSQKFLWFVGPKDQAHLGSVMATERPAEGAGSAIAANGDPITENSLIDGDAGVITVIKGNFSVGAFNLGAGTPAIGEETPADPCGDFDPSGTVAMPGTGNVKPTEDDPMVSGKVMSGPGTQLLCIDVDRIDPDNRNMAVIPEGNYTATVYTKGSAPTAPTVMQREDVPIGSIRHNGTKVQLAYLTTSEKHNHRLVISNSGAIDAEYTLGSFRAEMGVMVEALDMATGTVKAGETAVIPVTEMISISTMEGYPARARTAATLSVAANNIDIQVATTQVNREDSSTDTVIYASEGGATVQ